MHTSLTLYGLMAPVDQIPTSTALTSLLGFIMKGSIHYSIETDSIVFYSPVKDTVVVNDRYIYITANTLYSSIVKGGDQDVLVNMEDTSLVMIVIIHVHPS